MENRSWSQESVVLRVERQFELMFRAVASRSGDMAGYMLN